MESKHTYRVIAWWSSGRTGLAKSDSAPNAIHFTAPPEFGGLEGRWTPESLLLCAIAGCYTTTFRAIAEYSKFEYADLEVQVEGTIQKVESGYAFSEIIIRPNLSIGNEDDHARGLRLLQKTKALCLVGRALSVPQTFEPHIQVNTAVPAL
ncbi:MAG TPA: OsmC family protein [Terriglobales bacterium]|nr:OsmC family protein [Terriglobales bacterium]